MRVGLFVTCLAEMVTPSSAIATVTVLERLGHQVIYPRSQTCCGQMHTNSGYLRQGQRLGDRMAAIFEGFDAVVTPSSSCAGHLRDHHPGLPVFELSEFIVHKLETVDVGAVFPHRVAYHSSCHSLRVVHVGDAPEQLLRNVDGLQLVSIGRPAECCGFGGTFSVKNPDVSAAMLADKCDAIESAAPEYCTAVDGSCLVHIAGGLSRRSSPVRPIHLAEILAAQ